MYIYLFTFFLSLMFAYGCTMVKEKGTDSIKIHGKALPSKQLRNALAFASMLPLFLLSALRYDVGMDYFYFYVPFYQDVSSGKTMLELMQTQGKEPLFYLLNKLLVICGLGTVWLFTVTSLLIVGLTYLIYHQQSEYFLYSCVFFFCGESYFAGLAYVRQYMAIAIVLYGLKYAEQKKPLPCAVCIIAAFLTHSMSILLLPMYLFFFIKIHPLILGGAIFALTASKSFLVGTMRAIIQNTKYAWYLDSRFIAHYAVYTKKFFLLLIVFLLLLALYPKCKGNGRYHLYLNSAAAALYISCNFDLIPQMDRILLSYEAILPLTLAFIIAQLKNRHCRQIITFVLVAAFSIVTFDNIFVYKAYGVLPYRLVFNPSLVIW